MIPPQVTSFKYRHFAGGLRRLESSLWDNPLVLALPTMMSGPAPDAHPSRTSTRVTLRTIDGFEKRLQARRVGGHGAASYGAASPKGGKDGRKKRGLPVSRLLRRGSAKAKRPSISSGL
jgi:hypothetical protein